MGCSIPNAPAPDLQVTPYYDITLNHTKDIIRAYYSIGVNYKINSFNIGIYGDNVYSIGGIIGVSF